MQQHFESLLREYGPKSPHALGWGSLSSQRVRFRILAEVASLEGARVLDVGCGLGDFYRFLNGNKIKVFYEGIDLVGSLVEVARRRYPGVPFSVRDLLLEPAAPQRNVWDYVVASGIFYLEQDQPLQYMEEMVRTMFSLANRAVAFNTLISNEDLKYEGEFRVEPGELLAICRRIAPYVVLRQDYLKHDMTAYLYREPQ